MRLEVLPIVFATVAGLAAQGASATSCAGCVGAFAVWPELTATLPLNPVIVVKYCSREDRARGHGPYLKSSRSRVRLREIQISELGPLFRALVPVKDLEPNERYELHFASRASRRFSAAPRAAWMSGDAPDRLPPVWHAAPAVEYAGSSISVLGTSSQVLLSLPASDDRGTPGVLLELNSDSSDDLPSPMLPSRYLLRVAATPGAASAVLALESGEGCSSFRLLPPGRVFRAGLALVDAAGNVTPSPDEPLRFRIPEPRPKPSYEVRTVVPEHPVLRFKTEPQWHESAKRAGVQGMVTGTLSIGPEGEVDEVLVSESMSPLAGATIEALRKWRFVPARDGASSREVPFRTYFLVIHPPYDPDWAP